MPEHLVSAPDGRVLRVEECGDPRGKAVLTHHGTPGAGLVYPPHAAHAQQAGIRLLSYDRPGYGGSTSQPGRSVADCAADVRAIAGALGIDRLAVWGISGGGPHALACAALLPDLVVAAGVLASPAPFGAEGLDYYAGMGEENVEDTQLLIADEPAARSKCEADREQLLAVTAEQMASAFPTLLSDVDRAALTPDLSAYLFECNRFGLRPGPEGWWEDGLAEVKPWGFSVESINIPVQLWHGRHDKFVPCQHGEWLAARVPGVDAHLSAADGHVTLLANRVPGLHAWLLEHF